jgi:hypothetical protein
MLVAILIIGMVGLLLGAILWNRGPTEPEDHQPLIMQDGSELQLAGGRHRLRARSAGGGSGFVGGGDDGGGCS